MKKTVSLILALVTLLSVFAPLCFAEEFVFTLDENKRYTDISYVDEDERDLYFGGDAPKGISKGSYIAILSVLLVIAVVVLVVTLRKGRIEKEAYEAEIKEADEAEINALAQKKANIKEKNEEIPTEKE